IARRVAGLTQIWPRSRQHHRPGEATRTRALPPVREQVFVFDCAPAGADICYLHAGLAQLTCDTGTDVGSGRAPPRGGTSTVHMMLYGIGHIGGKLITRTARPRSDPGSNGLSAVSLQRGYGITHHAGQQSG